MKSVVAAVIAAAVVCVVLWFVVAQPRIAELQQSIATLETKTDQQTSVLTAHGPKTVKLKTHVLKKSATLCHSFSDSEATAVVGDTISWDVADFAECLKGGWKLEYRFDPPNGVNPATPSGTPPANGSKVTITATALKKGKYEYKVWRVKGSAEELLEDPQIVIQDPPTPVGPGGPLPKPPD